jgi:acyl-CoA synthetase (AMP-forming)/AMP-acid ligase II
VIDLIRERSRIAPEAPAVVHSGGTITYGRLIEWAEELGRGLSSRELSRFACVVTDPVMLIALLAAASAVGSEACSYPPQLHDAGIDELAAAFGHEVVVTNRDLSLATAHPIRLEDLPTPEGSLPTPASTPLLVLTTGTTARPKAAQYDWARLMAPARRRAGKPSERWLLAFNLNQFAGLQVLLHVLSSGATLVVPDSIQPRDALQAMLDHGVTHLSATPTFWRFLVALLGDDTEPPDIEQATLGGEAASAQLLNDVHRLFPRARVSHVYASTEVGSGVSVGDGQQGLPVSVLERSPDADVQFRIVDGELQARSTIGMLGYYGSDGNKDVTDEDGWRATGDLVEIRGDRICFVGRSGETFNVGGVKVHPLAIEDIVGAVPGVQLVHAYAKSNPITGQIVVVDVVAAPAADEEALEDAIREACEVLAPAAQPRRVRFVDELAVRENKVARTVSQQPPA